LAYHGPGLTQPNMDMGRLNQSYLSQLNLTQTHMRWLKLMWT